MKLISQLIKEMYPELMRPEQPEGHASKCPCYDCDAWAIALLDWEQDEVKAGRDPWAKFK
jgi:hypothetical protein